MPLRRPTYQQRLWVAFAELDRTSEYNGGFIPRSLIMKRIEDHANESNEKLGKNWEKLAGDAIRTNEKHNYIVLSSDLLHIRVKKATRRKLSDVRRKLHGRKISSPKLRYRTFCSQAQKKFGSIKYITKAEIAQECDEWRMKCLALIRDLDRSTSGDDSSSYAGSIWTETPDSQSTQSSHSFVDSVNGGSFIDNSEDVTMVEQQEMLDPVYSRSISPVRKATPSPHNPLPTPPDSNLRQRILGPSNSFSRGAFPPSPSASCRSITSPYKSGPSCWDDSNSMDDMDVDEGHSGGPPLAAQFNAWHEPHGRNTSQADDFFIQKDALQAKYDALEANHAGLQQQLDAEVHEKNRLLRVVDKLWKALRGERLTIFTLLGNIAESRQEVRDNRKKLRLVAVLKGEISQLERKQNDSSKERTSLRNKISQLEAEAKNNGTSMQKDIDEWKTKYHLKVDECTALRDKLAMHGATIRALALTMEKESHTPVAEWQS